MERLTVQRFRPVGQVQDRLSRPTTRRLPIGDARQAASPHLPEPGPLTHTAAVGKDAMRDCTNSGHIRIEGEPDCLACGYRIMAGDYVARTIGRRCPTCSAYHPKTTPHQGEMLAAGDTADPREWGGKG